VKANRKRDVNEDLGRKGEILSAF